MKSEMFFPNENTMDTQFRKEFKIKKQKDFIGE